MRVGVGMKLVMVRKGVGWENEGRGGDLWHVNRRVWGKGKGENEM